jgi:hypothetical protein
LQDAFKGIQSVDPAVISVAASINEKDVLFTTHYPAMVHLAGMQFQVADQSITQPNALKQTIGLATTVVQSEQDNNGMIDLDALRAEQATMMFFPYNELVTFIRDDAFKKKGTEYQFALASDR